MNPADQFAASGASAIGESAKESAFRAEVRAWLAEHAGPFALSSASRGAAGANPSLVFADVSDTSHVETGRRWQRLVFDAGYAGLAWPAEYGGRGLPPGYQAIWAQEHASARLPPPVNLIGEAMVGPALLVHGNEEQKRRWLEPILRGDEIWCQLFSEPEAGSDLAAVTTTAVRDGQDTWAVSGHKIWTSAAHYADYGILLARTDWNAPKHAGCTYFLVDMKAAGIEVRPLRQMTGGAAFNEVVLDSVRIPDAMRVGEEGAGWRVAVTTLTAERFNLGSGIARVGGGVDAILADLGTRAEAGIAAIRELASQVWIESRVSALMVEAAAGLATTVKGAGGPDSSVVKLLSTRVSRRCDELLEAMRGANAMLVDDYTPVQLWVPATRIAAGTEEVLKNLVADRVLGLPREPRIDAGMPFQHNKNQHNAFDP